MFCQAQPQIAPLCPLVSPSTQEWMHFRLLGSVHLNLVPTDHVDVEAQIRSPTLERAILSGLKPVWTDGHVAKLILPEATFCPLPL
jgi:hypothetical protein